MDTTETAGHVLRAPSPGDVRSVAWLLRAREEADLGEAEIRVEDVEADWAAPGVDLEEVARVGEDASGALTGYSFVSDGDIQVAVHPEAEGTGLGTALRRAAESSARARRHRVVRQFVPTANTAARALLLQAGWWPVHHYFHMHMALENAPPAPDVLARSFHPEHDAEAVWHLVEGAYADVEGHLPQTLDAWRATVMGKAGWDPALWILRHDADGLAGVALGEEEGDTGLVTAVAVAHRVRGRGYGRSLLLLLLDAFRARGLHRAEASAHGSTAGAARLFESAGMTAARRTERWEKILGG